MKKSAFDYHNSYDTRPSRKPSRQQRQFFRSRVLHKEWLRYKQMLKNSFLSERLS